MLETIFSLTGGLAMIGWAGLILLPRVRVVVHVVARLVIPVLIALLYVYLMATHFGAAPAEGGFGSLSAVAALFSVDGLLLAGWVHYLAFDLFVGSWEVEDAQAHGVPHLVLVPCLVATFMAGPAGFALYLAARALTGALRGRPGRAPASDAPA